MTSISKLAVLLIFMLGFLALFVCATLAMQDLSFHSNNYTVFLTSNGTINYQMLNNSIDLAFNGVNSELTLAKYLMTNSSLSNLTLLAEMEDCIEFLTYSASLLRECKLSSSNNLTDIQQWLSAALTYHIDCQAILEGGFMEDLKNHVNDIGIPLISNSLSLISALLSNLTKNYTRPTSYEDGSYLDYSYPKWLTPYDQQLLEMPLDYIKPSVIVSKDGSSKFKSIQDAVKKAPSYGASRFVIYIKAGVYNEIIKIPRRKVGITFIGDGIDSTIITGDLHVGMPGLSTYRTATLGISGHNFLARDLTIENSAGSYNHQGVALRVDSDMSAFYRCLIRGHQDTLYTHSLRQFYKECTITGTIDFIFGNAAAIFQDCVINIRPGRQESSTSVIAAHGRTDPSQTTGFIFQYCNVTATNEYREHFYANPTSHRAYLGRPWKTHARTIYMYTYLDAVIEPLGWIPWDRDLEPSNAYLAEFNNFGPGANSTKRTLWSRQLTNISAMQYSVTEFIQGDKWLPLTNVPFRPLFK